MFAQYFLTCRNDKEARTIAEFLISKRLVVCTKRLPISSIYPWKGKVEKADEVLLIMDGREKDFDIIEKEIKKIHSYEVFVLMCTPILKINKSAQKWMDDELKKY